MPPCTPRGVHAGGGDLVLLQAWEGAPGKAEWGAHGPPPDTVPPTKQPQGGGVARIRTGRARVTPSEASSGDPPPGIALRLATTHGAI